MDPILKIEGLTKKYASLMAVSQLTLSIEKGSVFGLLGPNGSGKTTTLGIVLGVTNSSSGNYSWFGNTNTSRDRKKIGALLETPNFYDYLSAKSNLKIVAKIKGLHYDEIDRVAEIVNLKARLNDKFKTYSLGMKQRLAIASALLGNPEVLVLDEPTNGLDPQGIAEIRTVIQNVSKIGVTIILASHALDEVEKVCSHVCVIKKGKTLVQGSVEEVLVGENLIEVSSDEIENLKQITTGFSGFKKMKEENHYLLITLNENTSAADFSRFLIENQIIVTHFVKRTKSLEEFFLETTNNA